MMEKKDDPTARKSLPEEKKPLRYEDFVKPNPYVKSWMEPYFPTNCYIRDFIVAAAGTAIGFLLAFGIYLTIGETGAFLFGVPVFVIFMTKFQGEVRGRYIAATILFRMEQNNAPKK
jgi:hypothetical protein